MQITSASPSDIVTPRTRLSEAQSGLLRAVPMMLGYLPLSFAFGVLALGSGLSTLNMLLMSLIVCAGSSQILAVQLMVLGASPLAIIMTTFVVNLRHTLMSSSLAPHLKRLTTVQQMAFALSLTDEAFALHSSRFSQGGRPGVWESFAVNVALHLAWLLGSSAALLVHSSPDFLNRFGLDFAPAAMFIALLVLMVKGSLQQWVVGIAGLLAVFLQILGAGTWSVIIATLAGATWGLWRQQQCNKVPSR